MHGNEEFCKFLIERGAYLNIQCQGGNTPLHMAFQSGSLSTCLYMLGKGADPNALNLEKMTPVGFGAPSLLRKLGLAEGVAYSGSKRVSFDNGKLWRIDPKVEIVKGPVAVSDYSQSLLLKQPEPNKKVYIPSIENME